MFAPVGAALCLVAAALLTFYGKPERLIVISPVMLAALPYLDNRLPHLSFITPTRVFLVVSILLLRRVPKDHERAGSTSRIRLWALVYFVVVMALTLGRAGVAVTPMIGNAVDLALLPFLYFAVLHSRVRTLRLGHATAIVAVLTLVFEVAAGRYEFSTGTYFLNLPQRAVIAYNGTDPSQGIRAVGTFITTETYSLFCALLGLFLTAYWARRRHRLLALLCAVVALTGCLFSGTRDTVIFYVPLVTYLYLRSGKGGAVRTIWAAMITVPTVLLINSLFHPLSDATIKTRLGNQDNITARIASYRAAWHIFADHWFSGVGFDRYYFTAVEGRYQFFYDRVPSVPYPHNSYLAVLAETGVVGAVVFARLWGSTLRTLWRDHDRSATYPIILMLLLTCLADNLLEEQAAITATLFFVGISAYITTTAIPAASVQPAPAAASAEVRSAEWSEWDRAPAAVQRTA